MEEMMPLNEYVCICGHKFDKLTLFSAADNEVKCPKCGAKVKKIMGKIAQFTFEGALA
jgi:putative FmdB family regulatory protein